MHSDDDSIETFRDVFFKIRRALGATAFGINEVRWPAGAEGPLHDEAATGHEEVYYVLSGNGTFTVDGDAVDVVEGDYLRVDAESARQAAAGPDGMSFIAIGARAKGEHDGRPTM